MPYQAQHSVAVNASTRQKFERYYSPEPLNESELAALLEWTRCYWHPDALMAYAETDGFEGCGDLVLRHAAFLLHAIWIGRRVRRRSCREAAEDFAEIAAEHGIGLVRFHVLLQGDDRQMASWCKGPGYDLLRPIWRAPRDRLKTPTLDEIRAAVWAPRRKRKAS